jgi:hypothetical protein
MREPWLCALQSAAGSFWPCQGHAQCDAPEGHGDSGVSQTRAKEMGKLQCYFYSIRNFDKRSKLIRFLVWDSPLGGLFRNLLERPDHTKIEASIF